MLERQQRFKLAKQGFGVKVTLLLAVVVLALFVAQFLPASITQWLLDIGPFVGALVFAIPFFFISRSLEKSTAIHCPNCNEEALEADASLRNTYTHRCSSCGIRYVNGREIKNG